MTLSEHDLQYIGQYVRAELPGWLTELGLWPALGREVLKGVGRVEDELKVRRGILLNHVQPCNERFADTNRRFEDANKHFDDMNRRFDDVNKRFDDNSRRHSTTQWALGIGFVVLTTLVTLYQFLG